MTNVIFSTDMYKEDSVKAMEQGRRGEGEKCIIKGENTKRPREWKEFLTNEENKIQLISLLRKVLGKDAYAKSLKG